MTNQPTESTFDIIIVGAGSAGCVLANRLSADPACRVLLLEAGGGDANPLISIPIGMGKLHQYAMYQWGDKSEPEPNLAGRCMDIAHGKVLGGSSSINVMAYTRGHPEDYNRWARNGATGWDYNSVLPYFKQCETWQSGENTWRGGAGELGTQFARTEDPIFQSWIEAGKACGHPFTPDYNGDHPEGFGRGQYTIADGRRASASRAFLRPARGRRNLTIISKAMVGKVIFNGLKAAGVEYVRRGEKYTAYADREIVLTLGAINTPQLLLLSGIGPEDHLRKIGITPIMPLPVGKNFQDHIGVSINWRRRSPGQFHRSLRFDRAAVAMTQAYLLGKGPATVVPGGLHAFVKSSPGVSQPDIEFMFHTVPAESDLWFPGIKPAYRDGYGIRPALLRPESRGEILLRSTDPRERPRIVYNALSTPNDLAVLREGIKRAYEVGQAAQMDLYRADLVTPSQPLTTDTEIDAYIRNTAITLYHPSCSCKMGTDDQSVVGPDLKVHALRNLRIADASVMPDLVSAHINAAVIMIAAKAADMIRA